ncbi:hypothetical protein D3C86_2115330 [compost metagenome]
MIGTCDIGYFSKSFLEILGDYRNLSTDDLIDFFIVQLPYNAVGAPFERPLQNPVDPDRFPVE